MALTGRGLLDFLAGEFEHCDDDLATALEIFERHNDTTSMALAHSFYAEQPAVLGNLDEARRRRLVVLDFYGASPDGAFEVPARSYSLAKLAMIDGDLEAAERHYRAAAEGFGRLDRPVMNSMCLGMVADFDERAGDYPAAIRRLEAAIETNESLLGSFTGSLQAHLGWVLLYDGQRARAETVFEVALGSARRVRHVMVLFQAQAGLAAINWLHGRHDAAQRRRLRGARALPGGRVPPVPESGRPHLRPGSRRRGVLRGTRRHMRTAGEPNRNGRRCCSPTPTACGSSRASRCRRSSVTTSPAGLAWPHALPVGSEA